MRRKIKNFIKFFRTKQGTAPVSSSILTGGAGARACLFFFGKVADGAKDRVMISISLLFLTCQILCFSKLL